MKRLNITGYVRKSANPIVPGAEHNRYANILNRQFYADKPMQKVVTDVTYIKHKSKWYYLACYIDLFNREILDYELGDTFDNYLVMKPAKRILEKAKSTDTQILFHSDQGVQYSSAGYCNLLQSYNVIQSMSRAGTPRDNAVIESFFGRFKDVCVLTIIIGIAMIFSKWLMMPFTTLTMLNLSEILTKNHQFNSELNWQLNLFCVY